MSIIRVDLFFQSGYQIHIRRLPRENVTLPLCRLRFRTLKGNAVQKTKVLKHFLRGYNRHREVVVGAVRTVSYGLLQKCLDGTQVRMAPVTTRILQRSSSYSGGIKLLCYIF